MFTDHDMDMFTGGNTRRFGGRGAGACWIDTDGTAHHVAWHEELNHEFPTGDTIHGYDAFRHGWVRVWTSTSSSEFGFEIRERLPNDRQVDFMVQAAACMEATNVFGSIINQSIAHQGKDHNEAVKVLKEHLPHS